MGLKLKIENDGPSYLLSKVFRYPLFRVRNAQLGFGVRMNPKFHLLGG